MDGTAADGQVDPGERLDAAEVLDDVQELEVWCRVAV
jgi:hypothetical protein